jgi:hypothetical protein
MKVFAGFFLFGLMLFFEEYALVYRLALLQHQFCRLHQWLVDWRTVLVAVALSSACLVVGILMAEDFLVVPTVCGLFLEII